MLIIWKVPESNVGHTTCCRRPYVRDPWSGFLWSYSWL